MEDKIDVAEEIEIIEETFRSIGELDREPIFQYCVEMLKRFDTVSKTLNVRDLFKYDKALLEGYNKLFDAGKITSVDNLRLRINLNKIYNVSERKHAFFKATHLSERIREAKRRRESDQGKGFFGAVARIFSVKTSENDVYDERLIDSSTNEQFSSYFEGGYKHNLEENKKIYRNFESEDMEAELDKYPNGGPAKFDLDEKLFIYHKIIPYQSIYGPRDEEILNYTYSVLNKALNTRFIMNCEIVGLGNYCVSFFCPKHRVIVDCQRTYYSLYLKELERIRDEGGEDSPLFTNAVLNNIKLKIELIGEITTHKIVNHKRNTIFKVNRIKVLTIDNSKIFTTGDIDEKINAFIEEVKNI